jgi:hypothetical protein
MHYIAIKQVDTPVHNCDIGMPLLYKARCFRSIPQQFDMIILSHAILSSQVR